jgi:hypothetical protein
MQLNAPMATRFLGIHNALLRRAAAMHAGHVVEQEGDSWSVAFHTSMDAVAFCLQVRLRCALMGVSWMLRCVVWQEGDSCGVWRFIHRWMWRFIR